MKDFRLIFIFFLMLAGCASNIPHEIREDISSSVSVNAVRSNFSQYEGSKVRWGGTIVSVENNASDTWIEIVGKDLNSYGRPLNTDQSMGRFMVRIDGFLDPEIYSEGRYLTVYGYVENRIVREIDDHPYTYPLVKAQTYYLWQDYYQRYAYYPYYPYYPYHHHPYHYSVRFGHHFGHHYRNHFGFHHYYPYW